MTTPITRIGAISPDEEAEVIKATLDHVVGAVRSAIEPVIAGRKARAVEETGEVLSYLRGSIDAFETVLSAINLLNKHITAELEKERNGQ